MGYAAPTLPTDMTTRTVTATDFGGPEVLVVTEIETPQPGPGEVLVSVRAIGVNPVDWKIYAGYMGKDPAALGRFGSELSGVVRAAGDGVDDWSEGEEVVATAVPGGAYASEVVVPAAGLVAKPEGVPFEVAAGVVVAGGTAAHALEVIGAKEGDVVLVHGGAGGVGGVTVQLAARRGARVIATASERNHDFLRSLGAEPVTYGEGLVDRVRAIAPDGVDAAVDTVGTDEAVDASIELVGGTDRIVSIAAFSRGDSGIAIINGSEDGAGEIRSAGIREVLDLLDSGDLDLPVERTYPLEETAQAHRDSQAGHTRGKLVVTP